MIFDKNELSKCVYFRIVMTCLFTPNGTAPPLIITGKTREISEQITVSVVGTLHN